MGNIKKSFLKLAIIIIMIQSSGWAWHYEKQIAADYALSWCGDGMYNGVDYACLPYKIYETDCANFVSQCLIGGGIDLTSGVIDDCRSIINCDDLNDYIRNFLNVNPTKITDCWPVPSNTEPGDVVIFGKPGNEYSHAAIVSSGNGKFSTLAAHTMHCCYRDFCWFMPSAFDRAYIYHIPQDPTSIKKERQYIKSK